LKITSIKQQAKRADRYSIYVDGEYAFSLSESALLETKLNRGQELTKGQVREYQKLSAEDKLYNQTLRYVALRPRSQWEISFYLEKKKGASPALAEIILNKLSIIGLIDDAKLAHAIVNDRRLFRPTSRRKLQAELKKKRIADNLIEQALGNDHEAEQAALQEVIAKKRKLSRYKEDDQKLMQYLARQGFRYDDIKEALSEPENE
jgi:regulatory protein